MVLKLEIGSPFAGGSGPQQRRSQFVGVIGRKTERRKDPRLVLAARMFGIQAVSGQLLLINDRGITARHLHRTRV